MRRDNRTGASSPSSVERPRGRLTRREHLDRYSSTARPATALSHRQPRRIPRAWPVHQQRGEIRRHELPADPSHQTPHTQHHIGRRAGGRPQLIMDRVQLPPARVPAAAQEPAAPCDPFRGPARWGREVRPTSQTRVTRIRRYGYCLEASRMGAQGSRCRRAGSVRRSGGSALACERPNWNLSSASFPRSYICAYIPRCAGSRPADLNGSAGRWCASSIGGEMPWRGGASFPHA